ncbi:hypothetical protein SARC_09749 [Sphaeroforma arctica JP610]|uniref:Uncharacterized protein n=1 Tax=Sphaeroforma arctica JP610 TaxID=667725 RepID=A0A0L0FMS1_9EUKA|nr:hypothetical protein SARC_09749 [Sphaeroforma arctica JP610]KNC77801.1 hypothetical protein SARC_09749 [Sphaeroforma arctica JP610]|eukprot:XP_014151703.1 hypothetical protein SARC_09749 [Sphaeroforma arctica JP610]
MWHRDEFATDPRGRHQGRWQEVCRNIDVLLLHVRVVDNGPVDMLSRLTPKVDPIMGQVGGQGANPRRKVNWRYPVAREAQPRTNEYKAAAFAFNTAEKAWGAHTHDAFALPGNQVPKYFSQSLEGGASAESWVGRNMWVNPPWELIPRVLAKVVAEHLEITLVCPYMPKAKRWDPMTRMRASQSQYRCSMVFSCGMGMKLRVPTMGSDAALSDLVQQALPGVVGDCPTAPALVSRPERALLVPTPAESDQLAAAAEVEEREARQQRAARAKRRVAQKLAGKALLARQGQSPYALRGLTLSRPEVRNVVGAAHNVYMHTGAEKFLGKLEELYG